MEGGMVLAEERRGAVTVASATLAENGLIVVARQVINKREYVLFRRVVTLPLSRIVIELDDERYDWVERLRVALRRAEREPIRVYVVSYAGSGGALGLAACLRDELHTHVLRCFHLPSISERFDPDASLFIGQVTADLYVNVLNGDTWGSYRHVPLPTGTTRQVGKLFFFILMTLKITRC